jgi:hypothetical protein
MKVKSMFICCLVLLLTLNGCGAEIKSFVFDVQATEEVHYFKTYAFEQICWLKIVHATENAKARLEIEFWDQEIMDVLQKLEKGSFSKLFRRFCDYELVDVDGDDRSDLVIEADYFYNSGWRPEDKENGSYSKIDVFLFKDGGFVWDSVINLEFSELNITKISELIDFIM